jgi:mRNA interferase MazF
VAITFHPRIGQILMCDFTTGFVEPEMVKRRPVLVISSALSGRDSLATIIALSTTPPPIVMPYHLQLPKASLPQIGKFQEKVTWLKGDMIYTVGFHRLDLIQLGTRNPITNKRMYYNNRLSREQMKQVYQCVLHGLNLGQLGAHL